jgi:Zn-finger nucleic acid-binding protein
MRCPIDETELRITDRQGIEIDYCPTCRGVWLDRGELDKILERSRQLAPYPDEGDRYREEARPPRDREYRDRDYRDEPYRGDYKKSRRRSFLEDILDFD